MVSGIVDLVHETGDTIEVIDYKTDRSRRAEAEYRKQLSVYYHVLTDWFDKHDVTTSIFYTASADRVSLEPLEINQLIETVRKQET